MEISQGQLYAIILERGFPEITKTIKKQILEGVQKHNLTFLEIGQIIYYMYDMKQLPVQPMYGLGPIYNLKTEALNYFKSLEEKTQKQEQQMEAHLKNEQEEKNVISIKPQRRKFKAPHIDLDKL